MAAQTGSQSYLTKYIIGAVVGVVVFVGIPETARRLHGGAFAQAQAPQQPGGGNCNNYGTFNGTMNNNCPTYIMPPRRPEGLYQSDQMIGTVKGADPGPTANKITFHDLRIASGTVDLSEPFEFQNEIVKCNLQIPRMNSAFTAVAVAGDTTCDIVGHR